jgi:hypothetical protein
VKSVVAFKCESASDAETLKLFTSVVTRALRIASR